MSGDDFTTLPHDQYVVSKLVRFEFHIGDRNLKEHVKDMRLRANVVLLLGLELIQRNHPSFKRQNGEYADLCNRYRQQCKQRYPWLDTPADVDGVIPPAVAEAVRLRTSNKKQAENEHSSPALAPTLASDVFAASRPTSCMPTERTKDQNTTEERQYGALAEVPLVSFRTNLNM
eukprot:3741444-Karenia_brevis.AAC.1